ncbi:MAG: hypothetical protein VZR27_02605 [Acutalibacteraceae bacterium]|nr:hypothetical protein [Clostridia bacterium]MEE3449580.1 hypothetical protein [Acutalibacteraceae bacterium]
MSTNGKKVKPAAIVCICLGVFLLYLAAEFESGFFATIAVFCFLLAPFAGKRENGSSVNANIRSGNIQSYHSAGSYGNSNYSASYKNAAQGEIDIDLLAEEATNTCPICKEFSSVGYCSRCGFRYKK